MATRYLEEVDYADVAAATLAKVWSGVEEESDGLSVHRERLELRADGSFTHTLAHTFALSKRASGEHDESSCVGHWRVFKVRHLGADVDAAADREIGFSRGSGSPPLLTEKIVVCGVNPHVNGFLGASCRLYPEASRLGVASTPPSQDAPRRSHPGGARHCASPPEDHEDANATELQPSDSEVRQLAEATGRPPDECLAALLHHGGSIEEAASRLCEGVESEAGDPAATNGAGIESAARTVSPTMAEVIALERQSEARSQEGQRLAEATGRTLQECLQALAAHNGRIDDAAAELLSLVHSDDDGGAPRPAPERGQLEGVDELRGPGAGGGGGAAAPGEEEETASSESTAIPDCDSEEAASEVVPFEMPRSVSSSVSSQNPQRGRPGEGRLEEDGAAPGPHKGWPTEACQLTARGDLEEWVPRDMRGLLTSIGSVQHAQGTCKPCLFAHHASKACANGVACVFCHFEHPPKRRVKNVYRQRRA